MEEAIDAGTPSPDAGTPSPDAGTPSPDAGMSTVTDVPSAPAEDAGTVASGASRSCERGLLCGIPGAQRSCCESAPVPGGSYMMGRALSGGDAFPVPNPEELPEHSVSIPAFSLDRYEVTVGRYRAFVEAWTGQPPAVGAGAHPSVPGSGWRASFNSHLPQSRDALLGNLHCHGGEESWTDDPGVGEERPVGCLNWYEAFAFCIWDGGRLPTESEWEYTAAGGDENRIYPWGSAEPDCDRVRPFSVCAGPGDILAPVGRLPMGVGRWGHEDFSGSAEEWILDYFDNYDLTLPTVQARVTPPTLTQVERVLRGLSLSGGGGDMRSADRGHALPDARYSRFGVRCARDLPATR